MARIVRHCRRDRLRFGIIIIIQNAMSLGYPIDFWCDNLCVIHAHLWIHALLDSTLTSGIYIDPSNSQTSNSISYTECTFWHFLYASSSRFARVFIPPAILYISYIHDPSYNLNNIISVHLIFTPWRYTHAHIGLYGYHDTSDSKYICMVTMLL